MATKQDIIFRLRDVFEGSPWHGDSVMDIINSVDFSRVNKSISGNYGKTIAHILQHLITWQVFILKKLDGQESFDIQLGSESDWPNKEISSIEEWNKIVNQFTQNNNEVIKKIENMNQSELDVTVPGKNYTMSFMLNGLTDHYLYHLGQVGLINAVLKKDV